MGSILLSGFLFSTASCVIASCRSSGVIAVFSDGLVNSSHTDGSSSPTGLNNDVSDSVDVAGDVPPPVLLLPEEDELGDLVDLMEVAGDLSWSGGDFICF